MADVLLLHHAQGRTDGILAFADTLRAAGHTVHTPDVYDGQTFADLDVGVGYAQRVGFGGSWSGASGRRMACRSGWCISASHWG